MTLSGGPPAPVPWEEVVVYSRLEMSRDPSNRKPANSKPTTPWVPSMTTIHGIPEEPFPNPETAAPHAADDGLGLSRTLTVEEVAAHLRISPSSVRNLIRRRELLAIDFVGKWRVKLRDLIDFIESRPVVGGGR